MPRTFAAWNDRRRPDARVFSCPGPTSSGEDRSSRGDGSAGLGVTSSIDGYEVLEGLVQALAEDSGEGIFGLTDMETAMDTSVDAPADAPLMASPPVPADAVDAGAPAMSEQVRPMRSTHSSPVHEGAHWASPPHNSSPGSHGERSALSSQVVSPAHESGNGISAPPQPTYARASDVARDAGGEGSSDMAISMANGLFLEQGLPGLPPPTVGDGVASHPPPGDALGLAAPDGGVASHPPTGDALVLAAPDGCIASSPAPVDALGLAAPAAGLIPAMGSVPDACAGASAEAPAVNALGDSEPQFTWQECPFLVFKDCSGIPIEPTPSLAGRLGVEIQLQPPLLYWKERRRWMWHKKWCLPRLHVRVSPAATLQAIASAGQRLFVMVASGTLRDGHHGLVDEGLNGECELPLDGGEVTFSSLLFQHTSFNCGNRPFHLVITILAAAAAAPLAAQGKLSALACFCSSPIHVDARKRTKGERPEASADDVRLMQRQRGSAGHTEASSSKLASSSAGAGPAAAAPLPPLSAQPSNGDSSYAAALTVLVDAIGSAVLELRSDLVIIAVVSSTALGYQPAELQGASLLSIVHPDERNALSQTTQALIAMSAGAQLAPSVATSAVRALHRALVRNREGQLEPVVVDSNISVLPGGSGEPQLLFSTRYAVPPSSPEGSGFRVFPANAPMYFSP